MSPVSGVVAALVGQSITSGAGTLSPESAPALVGAQIVSGAGTFAIGVTGERPAGGYERRTYWPKEHPRPRFNIPVEEVIETLASRHSQSLWVNEAERQSELRQELKRVGIEIEAAHIRAMNAQREGLIDAELARYMRVKQDDDDLETILLIAAAL